MAASTQRAEGRVLWMDPCFRAGRPTTQSLFQALPPLLEKGWQMELWCLDHDPVDARVKVVRLPRAQCLGLLEPLWFWFLAWCRLLWRRVGGESWDVVHTSGPDIPGADVMSLHFHNRTWIGLQWRERARSMRDRLKLLHTLVGVAQESLALASKRWRVVLPVSEGLAGRILPQVREGQEIKELPNILDGARFNPGVRNIHRVAMRARLQV